MTFHRVLAGALLLVLPLLSGCDDETLTAPQVQNDLFASYVSIGNSITAGFQSGGINTQTQLESYAVLLAEQMNTQFGVPHLNPPGCPPPLQSIPPQPPETQCALRSGTTLQINNVAVPGASLSDVLSNEDPNDPETPPGPNQLTQFILGGRTQIQAALDANPTFATVWVGNNDVLDAANAGTTALATDSSEFEARYRAITDQLRGQKSLQGAALVGVADVTAVPGIFPGRVYLGLAQQAADQLPDNFEVAPNCAPNDRGGQGTTNEISFLFALDLINRALQNPEQEVVLSCRAADPGVLTPNEREVLSARANTFNDIIAAVANENNWAFLDPNSAFDALAQAGEIPPVPNFASDQPFGRFFSLDGVHPSSVTHKVVTNLLIENINSKYGTSLQPVEAPDVSIP
jgi:lysophospholipase L1-like esterase